MSLKYFNFNFSCSSEEKSVVSNADVMPSRELTVNDVLTICSTIADREDITVQTPTRKPSLFRRFSEDLTKLTIKSKPGTSANNSDSDPDQTSPVVQSGRRRSSAKQSSRMEMVTDNKVVKDTTEKPNKENIPGLGGRDVVAIAILVDNQGVPMKTYTEHEDIPSEEYDAANQVYISRVPFREDEDKKYAKKSPRTSVSSGGSNVKRLSDILAEDIDVEKANKLKKRMRKVLIKLHTADLRTAQSFLKLDRFDSVRKEIKRELINFVEKDMKVNIITEDDED